ncbi:hypothetical protein TWF102_010333 [Orbilia oligospora]|uniref:Uncharacterized protein n=1 Tax=Orbilia oligospora TaxID=2813651 RepID=A0A7C8J919_ORBOL|nr:hypothetical protein TWF706_011144 [Orbilia oligospora]KAF3087952.1 hypothetical protein TWF102_010333 [Orbilia oligospora]KAF3095636.1 hypothetical protein TWF103_010100 [Orbilia oligospora]
MASGHGTTHRDNSCLLHHITDSIRLRNAQNKLHLNFNATVSINIPHPAWLPPSTSTSTSPSPSSPPSSDGNKTVWRALAVEGSQKVLLNIRLLWKQNIFPEEWSHVSESLGRVLCKSQLWHLFGLSASLEIPSHDIIYITLSSPHYTSLPPTLHLPTSSIRSIHWLFDFTPYATRPKSAGLRFDHIQPLFDECVNLFFNNKAGSLSLTGGLFVPGSSQHIRSSMASVEAITSTLARYASQCDDYTLFRSRIKQIKDKIEYAGPIAEQAIDLQKALSTQIYHQILKALQGTRLKKRTHYRSSSLAENELLAQPLEKFQDLFDGTRTMLSQDDNDDDDDGMMEDNNEDERSDFEDLFEGGGDNYSDFEDLLEETREIRQDIGDDMTPDSPTPVVNSNSASQQDQTSCAQNDYNMASECSDFGFTLLEDSYTTTIPSQQYCTPPLANNDEDYDHFTDIEAPLTSILPPSPTENITQIITARPCASQPFWENEESLMMLF